MGVPREPPGPELVGDVLLHCPPLLPLKLRMLPLKLRMLPLKLRVLTQQPHLLLLNQLSLVRMQKVPVYKVIFRNRPFLVQVVSPVLPS